MAHEVHQETTDSGRLVSRERPDRRHWALNAVGIGTILAICYYAEKALAVILISALLAFILAPVVEWLMRLHLPRSVAAAIAVILLLVLTCGVIYYSYNQASLFAQDLPKYTGKIQDQFQRLRQQAESFDVLGDSPQDKGILSVRPATDWNAVLTRRFGSFTEFFLAISFIPFLVYFMLTWQHHVRSSTVMLFPMENRHKAYKTLGLISKMIRSFMVGNLLIGFFLGVASTIVFWVLNLPFFYFIGFISGYLSLIPYMGVLLAMLPPMFVGMANIASADVFAIMLSVLILHLIAMNVLYPKVMGTRLQLNPLAVTMSLLVWAWLWGALGLLLAIPLTAAMKIIFDHVDSLKAWGNWLGE
ncbi:MAG TPA: AI-2E family transporter [Terriglobales bacterium]|jgi:predicted PurR-regulated permease PerM